MHHQAIFRERLQTAIAQEWLSATTGGWRLLFRHCAVRRLCVDRDIVIADFLFRSLYAVILL